MWFPRFAHLFNISYFVFSYFCVQRACVAPPPQAKTGLAANCAPGSRDSRDFVRQRPSREKGTKTKRLRPGTTSFALYVHWMIVKNFVWTILIVSSDSCSKLDSWSPIGSAVKDVWQVLQCQHSDLLTLIKCPRECNAKSSFFSRVEYICWIFSWELHIFYVNTR